MQDMPHEIDAYSIQHLLIVKAYAEVLGLVLDTLSGRSLPVRWAGHAAGSPCHT